MQVGEGRKIKVQEAEILRHEKELIATILKGGDRRRLNWPRGEVAPDRRSRGPGIRHPRQATGPHHLPEGRAEARHEREAEAYQDGTGRV